MSDETNVDESANEFATSSDELDALYDEIEAREAGEAEDTSAQGPERDEQGRFKARESAEAAAPDEIQDVEPETGLAAPASWTDDEKAVFQTLPKEAQEAFLRREQDWQKADGERAEKLKGYEPIDAVLQPIMQQHGVTPEGAAQYVGQLHQIAQWLRSDPASAFRYLHQQYGYTPTEPGQQEDVDPSVAPLMQEVNSLRGQLQQLATSQQQREQQQMAAEIAAFAQDHPHFEAVRGHMGALIGSGQAKTMAEAYEQAVWANPDVRSQLLAEQAKEAEQQRSAQAEEKAKKARRVAETNLSSKGSANGSTPQKFNSRIEELEHIYDSTQGA